MYCNRLHAWWSNQSWLATLLSSIFGRHWVGHQTLWWFRLIDLSTDERVGFHVCLCYAVLSVCCSLVITCWERADLMLCFLFLTFLYGVPGWYIENTRWVSFDIKFTRQGFENACWHREACRAIQHAFSKPSLVNLISKDTNLVFYLSVYPLLSTLQTSVYDVLFFVDPASLATSFKKCNVIMTW